MRGESETRLAFEATTHMVGGVEVDEIVVLTVGVGRVSLTTHEQVGFVESEEGGDV